MTKKPTHSSVTVTPCTCGYLERAANDESNPICFDERTGEFEFHHQRGRLNIYHCPFCGGAAPHSKRDRLFHSISSEEQERLLDLVRPLKSIAEAIATLGPPDSDSRMTTMEDEKVGRPPNVIDTRSIRYEHLSPTASVAIIEHPDGTVYYSLSGKARRPDKEVIG